MLTAALVVLGVSVAEPRRARVTASWPNERAAEAVVKQLQHFDDGALVLQNSDAGQLHAGDGGKGASGGGDVVVRE
jgi:hypothetical protein